MKNTTTLTESQVQEAKFELEKNNIPQEEINRVMNILNAHKAKVSSARGLKIALTRKFKELNLDYGYTMSVDAPVISFEDEPPEVITALVKKNGWVIA